MDHYLLYLNAVLEERVAIAARHVEHRPVDAAELEQHTRQRRQLLPGITNHLPTLPLHKVLSWFERHRRIDQIWTATSWGARDAPDPSLMATEGCRSHRQHCWQITDGATGRARCRCRGQAPVASAWNGRLPWPNAARQAPTAS